MFGTSTKLNESKILLGPGMLTTEGMPSLSAAIAPGLHQKSWTTISGIMSYIFLYTYGFQAS